MEKKFDLSEQVRKDLEQKMDKARKALEVKIQDLKEKLRRNKEAAVREYRDSNALLSELGDLFLQGFMTRFVNLRKLTLPWMCP